MRRINKDTNQGSWAMPSDAWFPERSGIAIGGGISGLGSSINGYGLPEIDPIQRLAADRAKRRQCHDVHVSWDGERTTIAYHHDYDDIKYHQKHTVAKQLNFDQCKEIIHKIEAGWADDLMTGISLDSLVMEDYL